MCTEVSCGSWALSLCWAVRSSYRNVLKRELPGLTTKLSVALPRVPEVSRRGERTGDLREFRSITTALILKGRQFERGALQQHMWKPETSLLSAEKIATGLKHGQLSRDVSGYFEGGETPTLISLTCRFDCSTFGSLYLVFLALLYSIFGPSLEFQFWNPPPKQSSNFGPVPCAPILALGEKGHPRIPWVHLRKSTHPETVYYLEDCINFEGKQAQNVCKLAKATQLKDTQIQILS